MKQLILLIIITLFHGALAINYEELLKDLPDPRIFGADGVITWNQTFLDEHDAPDNIQVRDFPNQDVIQMHELDICFNSTRMVGIDLTMGDESKHCITYLGLSNENADELNSLANYISSGNIEKDIIIWIQALYGYPWPTKINQFLDWLDYLDELSVIQDLDIGKLKQSLRKEAVQLFGNDEVERWITKRWGFKCKSSNALVSSACAGFAYYLYNYSGRTKMENSRNICSTGNQGPCCLSWSKSEAWSIGGIGYAYD
ncbi:hypothetical protein DFJ63DRAFT_96937 [Scheffersomyces coipomensis]|uniref:uncharacterized protein n=1 Tax=Scheffersomyces coipomensis TaxID=1788519 RepID=UPI00315DA30A